MSVLDGIGQGGGLGQHKDRIVIFHFRSNDFFCQKSLDNQDIPSCEGAQLGFEASKRSPAPFVLTPSIALIP